MADVNHIDLSDPTVQWWAFRVVATLFSLMVLRAMISALLSGALMFVPLAYFYLAGTCPSLATFDTRKELKRVLRGHHLPEDHPEKPQGFLQEAVARVVASVTAEATTAAGYELTSWPVAGCLILNRVRVPSANRDVYWVGAAGKWRYLGDTEARQVESVLQQCWNCRPW